MTKNNRRLIIIALFLLLVLVVLGWWFWQSGENAVTNQGQDQETSQSEPDIYKVAITRVIDGDTIEAGEKKIRLIGVDTEEISSGPDSQPSCRAQAAKSYLENLLLGKQVAVEVGQDPEDDYGRTLAYVFLDQELINAEIIRMGLGDVWLIAPNLNYSQDLIEAQIVGQEKQNETDFCQLLDN